MSVKLPDGTTISGGINYRNVVLRTGGTMTGPLILSGDPTDELHAVTKQYLEKIVGDIGDKSVIEYINEKIVNNNCVVNAKTHYDFPSMGNPDTIYKAEEEKKIYQWNSEALKYEVICETGDGSGSGDILNIKIINGGNAYGVY